MKKTDLTAPLGACLLLVVAQLVLGGYALAQGTFTVTFTPTGPYGYTYNWYESGVWFRVAADPPHIVYDPMILVGTAYSPNGTPFLEFRTGSDSNYVVFSLTNGNTFGLTSVDLLDPVGLSLTQQITMSFSGVRADNSVVTAFFTTPIGGTTNFTTFQFGSDFAAGLTTVRIPSRVWAMDNVVFGNVVPEPRAITLGLLALMVLGGRAARRRWRSSFRNWGAPS
jgi:hypothetical protein